jgi:succinate dehydrogenase / fumarate reductase, iron-sulfur subunit
VLDGILQAKDRDDGSLAVRCSCRAAICGSCGMKINGQSTLACKTMLEEAQSYAESHAVGAQEGEDKTKTNGKPAIVVEPMGNMPVLRDLITDMDAVHWKKIQRVVPWLLPQGPPPEREYMVPAEST